MAFLDVLQRGTSLVLAGATIYGLVGFGMYVRLL